jgi:hypothetical protein
LRKSKRERESLIRRGREGEFEKEGGREGVSREY